MPLAETSAARRLIARPTLREPVKAISADVGMLDERRADRLADARQDS